MQLRHHISQRLLTAAFLAALAAMAQPAIVAGATRTWTGAAGDLNWNNRANWSEAYVPGSSDLARFNVSSATNCNINANVNVAGILLTDGFFGTITQGAGITITVGSTGFTQNNGTFIGSAAAMTINGLFALGGGTFTATSGNLSILRNFTITGGTFNHNGGTITLTSYDKTMSIGTAVLNNLVISTEGNSLTTTDTATVAGNLTINSVNYMSGGTIAVAGNVTTNDTNLIGYPGTIILFNGTGNQTLTASVSLAEVPSVNINKSSGKLSLVGDVGVFNNWTHTAGTVECGTGTLTFLGYDKTVTAGSMSYGNVTYDTGGNSITTSGTMTVNGTFTIKSINYMSGGTIACKGNVVTMDNNLIGYPGTVIQIDGTENQTISANGSYNLVPTLTINKPSGKLTLTDSIGVFNDFTYTAGEVDASACTVKFVGYDKTVTSTAGMVFSNVELATGGNSVTIAGALKCSGNFTLSSVNYFLAADSGSNGSIYVGGNLTSADNEVNSWYGVPFILDGSGDQLITSTPLTGGGYGKFPRNITINKVRCSGGEVKLGGNLTLNQSSQCLYVTEGTLNIEANTLAVNGSSSKLVIEKGGILKMASGAGVTTNMYYPELQCGSMVVVTAGSTYSFPSNTSSMISGLAGNTYWTTTGSCVSGDTPSSCETVVKKKIIQWTDVRNVPH